MKVIIESSELLRIVARQKARTLKKLEDVQCPDGYLDIVRIGFDHARNDLVSATNP